MSLVSGFSSAAEGYGGGIEGLIAIRNWYKCGNLLSVELAEVFKSASYEI